MSKCQFAIRSNQISHFTPNGYQTRIQRNVYVSTISDKCSSSTLKRGGGVRMISLYVDIKMDISTWICSVKADDAGEGG